MKSMKAFVGVALVAAFVMSVVAVGSASASTQTVLFPGGGGAKPNFSSIAEAGILASGANKVKCASARNSGEAIPGSDRLRNIRILFSGCKAELIGGVNASCNSSNQPAGSIQTFPLEAELGEIAEGEGTKLIVGYVLKAETKAATENPNTLFAEFKCSVDTVKVRGREVEVGGVKTKERGGIIAEILPVGPTHRAQVNELIDPGTAVLATYKKGAVAAEQAITTLTVLGTKVEKLLLEAAVTGGAGFELAGLEEEKDVELFFLESVELSCKGSGL